MQQGSKIKRFGLLFMHHFQMAEVTTSAAVLAYYTLLSVFPALLVIGNLLPMIGLDAKTVLPYLQSAVPPTPSPLCSASISRRLRLFWKYCVTLLTQQSALDALPGLRGA
mgnify:CR=1 FL=1